MSPLLLQPVGPKAPQLHSVRLHSACPVRAKLQQALSLLLPSAEETPLQRSSSVELWMHSSTGVFVMCSMVSCRCLNLSFSCWVRAASLAFFCWSLSASLHTSGELPFLRRLFFISRALCCLSRYSRAHCRQAFCCSSQLHALPGSTKSSSADSGSWSRASATVSRVVCCPALWLLQGLCGSASWKDQGSIWQLATARAQGPLPSGEQELCIS